MRRVITAETVEAEAARGVSSIAAPRGRAVITPGAWTRAQQLGVAFDQSETAADSSAHADRHVDASKVVHVRGDSLRLGPFAGAPGVGLADVITGKDGSPMTAGVMS